jgi:hypothetical protein
MKIARAARIYHDNFFLVALTPWALIFYASPTDVALRKEITADDRFGGKRSW